MAQEKWKGLADVAQWLNIDLCIKSYPVQFLLKTHAQLQAWSVEVNVGMQEAANWWYFSLINVSISLFLYLPLSKINKKHIFLKKS